MYYLCSVRDKQTHNKNHTVMFTTLAEKLGAEITAAKEIKIYKERFWGTYRVYIELLCDNELPNGKAINGKFIEFFVSDNVTKIEFSKSGVVEKSETDKANRKLGYSTAMPIHKLVKKSFRRTSYKSEKELITKISNYTNEIVKALTEYTGGYPYSKGI